MYEKPFAPRRVAPLLCSVDLAQDVSGDLVGNQIVVSEALVRMKRILVHSTRKVDV